MKDSGHPEPEFEISSIYFRIILCPREGIKPDEVVDDVVRDVVKFGVKFGVKGKRRDRLVNIILELHEGKSPIITELSEKYKISERMIEKDITFLRKEGLVIFEGTPKTGRYVLTEKGKKLLGA